MERVVLCASIAVLALAAYFILKHYVKWKLRNAVLGVTALSVILAIVNAASGMPLAEAVARAVAEALASASAAGFIYAFLLKPVLSSLPRRARRRRS